MKPRLLGTVLLIVMSMSAGMSYADILGFTQVVLSKGYGGEELNSGNRHVTDPRQLNSEPYGGRYGSETGPWTYLYKSHMGFRPSDRSLSWDRRAWLNWLPDSSLRSEPTLQGAVTRVGANPTPAVLNQLWNAANVALDAYGLYTASGWMIVKEGAGLANDVRNFINGFGTDSRVDYKIRPLTISYPNPQYNKVSITFTAASDDDRFGKLKVSALNQPESGLHITGRRKEEELRRESNSYIKIPEGFRQRDFFKHRSQATFVINLDTLYKKLPRDKFYDKWPIAFSIKERDGQLIELGMVHTVLLEIVPQQEIPPVITTNVTVKATSNEWIGPDHVEGGFRHVEEMRHIPQLRVATNRGSDENHQERTIVIDKRINGSSSFHGNVIDELDIYFKALSRRVLRNGTPNMRILDVDTNLPNSLRPEITRVRPFSELDGAGIHPYTAEGFGSIHYKFNPARLPPGRYTIAFTVVDRSAESWVAYQKIHVVIRTGLGENGPGKTPRAGADGEQPVNTPRFEKKVIKGLKISQPKELLQGWLKKRIVKQPKRQGTVTTPANTPLKHFRVIKRKPSSFKLKQQ